MSIGEKIREGRKKLGLSQESLAAMLGVSTQAVSTWERDENAPETKKLLSVSQALNLSLDYLMADEDDWKLKIFYPERPLDKAIAFAAAKHSGTYRKGTTIPYITHPMEAAAIAAALTDDEDVIAAAVLHDVLEDTDTTAQELEIQFRHRITSLVADESEDKRENEAPESTWKIRKQETLDRLEKASHEARIIALGDKLANVRALRRDYELIGDKLWERFNEKDKTNHAWYYGRIYEIFMQDTELKDSPLLEEYARCLEAIFHDVCKEEETDSKPELKHLFYDEATEIFQCMEQNGHVWSLILDRTEDASLQQLQIMAMIYDCFLRSEIIGFADTHMVIVNDPESDDVSWKRTNDGYCIHMCAVDGDHWCQVAYQLGYAMMHCLIDHLGKDKPEIRWAEELICETMAVSLLKRLGECWEQTPFYEKDPDYAAAIAAYINDLLQERGTSALIRCKDRETLKALNEENSFDDRLDESHDLYNKITADDFLRLAKVRQYAADDLLLYTHFWRDHSEGSQAIDYICRLQEQIPGCELPAGIPIYINLENSKPTPEQLASFGSMICSLRNLPYEFIHFIFLDESKGEMEQIGLVSLRFVRRESGDLAVFMRWDQKNGRKMYWINCNDNYAVGVLDYILTTDNMPDTADWADVTNNFFDE